MLVASCIMLDSVRNKLPGGADVIFPAYYMASCDDALYDFANFHWPCEFTSPKGRCINTKIKHLAGKFLVLQESRASDGTGKMSDQFLGHQLSNGKIPTVGEYTSKFSPNKYINTWRSHLYKDLDQLLQRHIHAMADKDESQRERVAIELHQRAVLEPFFRHVGSSSMVSVFLPSTEILSAIASQA